MKSLFAFLLLIVTVASADPGGRNGGRHGGGFRRHESRFTSLKECNDQAWSSSGLNLSSSEAKAFCAGL